MATEQRILVFDVETTGTDKRKDQVIELCVQFGVEVGARSHTWRILPSVEIGPGAQAVHGISMADLAGCPRFAEVADAVREVFAGADVLVGYNLAFDIDMLQAEYQRIGQPPLDVADKQIIDPFRLWQQCEPRSLQDAHRRFVGQEFAAAHSATADVAATGRVLRGMIEAFKLAGDWDDIARVCEPERSSWIGPSRHLRWDEGGQPVLSFGKHAGMPLSRLAQGPDAGYLRWVCEKDFPHHVREICEQALALAAADFAAWLAGAYGAPAPADGAEERARGAEERARRAEERAPAVEGRAPAGEDRARGGEDRARGAGDLRPGEMRDLFAGLGAVG